MANSTDSDLIAEINFIVEVVEQACAGDIPECIARTVLRRRGWVLRGYGDHYGFASHVSGQHCGSCREWVYDGFHMGIYDGTCELTDRNSENEEHCEKWKSVLEL